MRRIIVHFPPPFFSVKQLRKHQRKPCDSFTPAMVDVLDSQQLEAMASFTSNISNGSSAANNDAIDDNQMYLPSEVPNSRIQHEFNLIEENEVNAGPFVRISSCVSLMIPSFLT